MDPGVVATEAGSSKRMIESNYGSVAEFVGNPCEDGGLTAGGTMSFSL